MSDIDKNGSTVNGEFIAECNIWQTQVKLEGKVEFRLGKSFQNRRFSKSFMKRVLFLG